MIAIGPRRKARLSAAVVLAVAGLLTLFVTMGRSAVSAAREGRRALGALDPLAFAAQQTGRTALTWLVGHVLAVSLVIGVIAAAIGAVALGRRARSAALPLLALGVALATVGEGAVLGGRGRLGALLLGAAGLVAMGLGTVAPIRRLAGFPSPESPEDRFAPPAPSAPVTFVEIGAVLTLVLGALFLRTWALNQLPSLFDDETIYVLVQSATGFGLKTYFQSELLGTGNGIFHLVTNWLGYRVFGPSFVTVRLTAVFWGLVGVPLFYMFVRRLAGVPAALAGTLLFVCAPEQIWWSRNENSFFSLVAIAGLVTAHLTLSLVRTLSWRAAFVTPLWMPLCRFFYTPCFILFALPPAMVLHALVFRREARRRTVVLLGSMLAGITLWIFSLTLFLFPVSGRWEFVHPAKVRGAEAWRSGISPDAGPWTIMRVQAARVATNTVAVVRGLADNASVSSHWYQRFVVSGEHQNIVVAGFFVVSVLAVGYFLAQLPDARAALLLSWMALGLLPAVLSDEPEARRFSLLFPALLAAVAVFLAAASRILADSFPARVGRPLARAVVAAAVLAIAFCGAASDLLLPVHQIPQEAEALFARPLFERCGTVFHNLYYRAGPSMALPNLDRLLLTSTPVCYQYLSQRDWPAASLFPSCSFRDEVFTFSLPPAEIAKRAEKPRADRVGFLLEETFESRADIELLQSLYPGVRLRRLRVPDRESTLVAIEVDGEQFRRLRSVEVVSGRTPPPTVFSETVSEAVPSGSSISSKLIARAAVLVPGDGYYRMELDPACREAELRSGSADATAVNPYVIGLYPVTLQEPEGACGLPVRLVLHSPGQSSSAKLVNPRVLDSPGAAAPRVVRDRGWGKAERVATFSEMPTDVALDGRGVPTVLLFDHGTWRLRRIGKAGDSFDVVSEAGNERSGMSLACGPDGTSVIAGPRLVEFYDVRGRRFRTWPLPYYDSPSDLALTTDGDLLFAFPYRQALDLMTVDGKSKQEMRTTELAAPFEGPQGVALSAGGELVVLDVGGNAHLFRFSAAAWPPRPERSFHVAFQDKPMGDDAAGVTFDAEGRGIFFPHHTHRTPLWYTAAGERVMAESPDSDLGAKEVGRACAVAASREALYVVDCEARALVRVARR